jgi:hypothetical protein
MQSTKTDPTGHTRLQLSATQLIASALAAVTATIAASVLGINGTVIGAAIASVLTVSGNAIYSHSIHRTRERVLTAVPVTTRRSTTDIARSAPAVPQRRTQRANRPRLRRFGFAVVGVFVAMLTILTSAELVAGRPISDLLQGKSASGTSLSNVLGSTDTKASTTPTPAVTVTQTVVPNVVTSTPTVTQTAPAVTVTPTTTPTVTATSMPTATPTPSTSTTPTGTTTP